MDHSEAMRLKAAEAYLLDDLNDELREAFEEHYFSCQECAIDVQVGTAFVEGSKIVLSNPESKPVPLPNPKPWLGWLRPAFAVPVMALLLVAVGYQAIALRSVKKDYLASTAGQSSSSIYLPAGVSRSGNETIAARLDSPFNLRFDIPWEKQYSSYIYELRSPSGELLWSVTVPTEAAKNSVSVATHLTHATSGDYRLEGRGINSANQAETKFDPQTFKVEFR